MLVCAVRSCAVVAKFTLHFWVQEYTLIAVCTLREKFAFLRWMHVWAFFGCLLTVGEVLAADLFAVSGYTLLFVQSACHAFSFRQFPLQMQRLMLLGCKILCYRTIIIIARSFAHRIHRTKALQPLLFQFLCLIICQFGCFKFMLLWGMLFVFIVPWLRVAAEMILIVFVALFIRRLLVRMIMIIESITTNKLIKITVHIIVSSFTKSNTTVELARSASMLVLVGTLLIILVGLSLIEFSHRLVIVIITRMRTLIIARVCKISPIFPKFFMVIKIIIRLFESLNKVLSLRILSL